MLYNVLNVDSGALVICVYNENCCISSTTIMKNTYSHRQKNYLQSSPAEPFKIITSNICFSTHMCYIKFLSGQKHSCSQGLDDTAPFFGSVLLSWNIKPRMKPQTYLPHNLQNNEGKANEWQTNDGRIMKLEQEWIKPKTFMEDECIHRLSLLTLHQWHTNQLRQNTKM